MDGQRQTYAVMRVLNVSTHEAVRVGTLEAASYEEAQRLACEQDLILDFQTFRVELVEPPPNADATLEIIAACDRAGEAVARYVVSEHPQMDTREVAALASQELFYAAQDTAQACHVGVVMERA